MYIKFSDIEDLLTKMLKEPAYQHTGEDWYVGVCSVASELADLPKVELQEVKHAHRTLNLGMRSYCSNCGHLAYCENYCSYCGAKMDGKRTNENV